MCRNGWFSTQLRVYDRLYNKIRFICICVYIYIYAHIVISKTSNCKCASKANVQQQQKRIVSALSKVTKKKRNQGEC